MGAVGEWIFSTDHKRIGIMYLVGSIAAFVVAGLMALGIRFELANAGPDIVGPQTYNQMLYFHGAAMILGFQIPALTGFFANYLVPLQIGAADVAFPRLNSLSLWLFWAGIILALVCLVIPDPPDIMWTGYPPYSSVYTPGNTAFYTFTVLILGFASIAGGVNLITTIIFMRAPGMGWNQLNMFIWCTMAAFILQLIFVPVLGAAVTMVSFDKYLGTSFFVPGNGGDVLLYQNLFWFYSHPAVYVILLPFIGVVYEIVATFARNMVFNYKVAVWGGVGGVTLVGGEVWIHHLYVTGMPDWLRVGMMLSTLMISVPVGLLVISLVGTLYKGAIEYRTPMLYAIGFIFVFLIGGLTGIPNAMVSIDLALSDGYFVMAHFHYVMAVSGVFGIFGGVYFWWPKMSGRMYNEAMAKLGFYLLFAGVNLTFFPMFYLGLEGMPRRYFDYSQFPIERFEGLHKMSTAGAVVIALAALIIIVNWIHGFTMAPKVTSDNPWGSKSLEWTHTKTPPGPGNFPTPPQLSEDWHPYGYGK